MKTIFDKATRDQLINRINTLTDNNTAQWGKMNVFQMVKHCIIFEEMILGKKKYKWALIGRVFGKMALKGLLKDERPIKKNMPAGRDFTVKGNGNMPPERVKWIALIEEYEEFLNHEFVHPFFGKMTKEQVGCLVYKHTDHHLRQFNC